MCEYCSCSYCGRLFEDGYIIHWGQDGYAYCNKEHELSEEMKAESMELASGNEESKQNADKKEH
jgi:hypothetical protein